MRVLRWFVVAAVILAARVLRHGLTIARKRKVEQLRGEQQDRRDHRTGTEMNSELASHKQSLVGRRSRTHAEMDRIRDAAKWGTGLFTATGALLITLVASDGLGSFESFLSWRVAVSVLGTILAIAAILAVMYSLLPIFTPPDWTLKELLEDKRYRRVKTDVEKWYKSNPQFLTWIDSQSSEVFKDLEDLEEAWQRQFDAARDDPRTHHASYEAFDVSYRMTVLQARYVGLRDDFRRKMKYHIPAAIVAMLIGIAALAWATHPPTTDNSEDTPDGTAITNTATSIASWGLD